MYWHHPAIYLLILLHILIFAIVALIVRKQATIYIGLTDEWMARRRTRMIIATCIALASVPLVALGIILSQPGRGEFVLLIVVGIFALLGGAIYGAIACRLVWPKRITDQYVWIKGVHPNFLDRLPTWPYGIV